MIIYKGRDLNRKRINHLTSEVESIFDSIDNIVLAGGAVRTLIDRTPIIDYDFFIISNNIEEQNKTKEEFKKFMKLNGFSIIFQCPEDKLISFRSRFSGIKFQLIMNQIYPTMFSLLNSFDIIAAAMAIDKNNFYALSYYAIKSAKFKRIEFNTIHYPVATLSRIDKYKKKGYSISEESYRNYFIKIREGDLNDLNFRKYID